LPRLASASCHHRDALPGLLPNFTRLLSHPCRNLARIKCVLYAAPSIRCLPGTGKGGWLSRTHQQGVPSCLGRGFSPARAMRECCGSAAFRLLARLACWSPEGEGRWLRSNRITAILNCNGRATFVIDRPLIEGAGSISGRTYPKEFLCSHELAWVPIQRFPVNSNDEAGFPLF